jgi:hypothetical protein
VPRGGRGGGGTAPEGFGSGFDSLTIRTYAFNLIIAKTKKLSFYKNAA